MVVFFASVNQPWKTNSTLIRVYQGRKQPSQNVRAAGNFATFSHFLGSFCMQWYSLSFIACEVLCFWSCFAIVLLSFFVPFVYIICTLHAEPTISCCLLHIGLHYEPSSRQEGLVFTAYYPFYVAYSYKTFWQGCWKVNYVLHHD